MRVGMGMQGVRRHDSPCDGQERQHDFGHGNLIGFLTHPHLQERFLTLVRTKRQQMRCGLIILSRPAYGLAVQGDGLIDSCMQRGLDPASQHLFDRLGIQAWQQLAIERTAGRQKEAWPKDLPQVFHMLPTPLRHRLGAITVAQQRR
jgi:hypothetical protein